MKEHGKRLIKSTETVRSWGAPRNKRYRNAKTHRGKNYWKFGKRVQKVEAEAHVNIHYSRACLKNYTRFAFSNKTKPKVSRYIIRRAADDKAYIRAGTSEGFNRPLRTPLSLTQEDLAFKLPAYDYPKEVGYVSPGVIQILADMEENDDKFFISKNLVTVLVSQSLFIQAVQLTG